MKPHNLATGLLLAAVAVALVAAAVGLFGRLTPAKYWFKDPQSFGECIEAGGKVAVSYPARCFFRAKNFTQSLSLEQEVRLAVERVLLAGKTANPNEPIPQGTRLLNVKVSGLEQPGSSVPEVTLDFSKEILADGIGTFEGVLQYAINAVHPLIQGEGQDPRYPEMRFVTLIEGRPYVGDMPDTGSETTKIKIALLSAGEKDGDAARMVGCDLVVFEERTVPKTTAPLTAAMKELFARREPWPYGENSLGNFLTKQKDLSFDRAVVQDGAAKIYLKGKFALGGVCDDPRTRSQIEATAKQFSTVRSVEIYLNGNLYQGPSEMDGEPALSQELAVILAKNAWGDCKDICTELIVSRLKKDGLWYVEAIYEGLYDDSTRSTSKVARAFYNSDGTWRLGDPVVTQRCQPGRGHQEFSTAPCI